MNSLLTKYLDEISKNLSEEDLIKHERKVTTLSERIEINDINLFQHEFKVWVLSIKYGCKSIKNKKLNDDNFEEIVNELSNEEIIKLGTWKYLDINKFLHNKKKSSQQDSQSVESSGGRSE